MEGLGESLLEGVYLFEPVEGLGVGLGFEEGGGFGFALDEERVDVAQELADLLEEVGGGGENVVHLGGLVAALKGEEVLEAALEKQRGDEEVLRAEAIWTGNVTKSEIWAKLHMKFPKYR